MTVLPGVATVKNEHGRGSMDTRPPLHNKLIQKDQTKKTQSYKVESVSKGTNMDMHNFSLENKREPEFVSNTQPEPVILMLFWRERKNIETTVDWVHDCKRTPDNYVQYYAWPVCNHIHIHRQTSQDMIE